MKTRIIINADDFGLSASVNDGIFEAMDAGVVTDVSLIANGEGFDHAVQGIRLRKKKAVGLHFCIVDMEKPLSLAATPLTEDGHFFVDRNKLFARCLINQSRMLEAIRGELEAQIQKVYSVGLSISHLNSHQHTHLFPGICEVALEACARFGIPYLRAPATRMRSPIAWAVQALSARAKRLAAQKGIKSVSSLGFEASGRVNSESLRNDMKRACERFSLAEIMVHPGRADEGTRIKYAHWNYDWDRELNVLFQAKSFLSGMDIALTSFSEEKITDQKGDVPT